MFLYVNFMLISLYLSNYWGNFLQKSHGEAPKGVVWLEIKISNMYPKKRFLVNGTYNSFNLRLYITHMAIQKTPKTVHNPTLIYINILPISQISQIQWDVAFRKIYIHAHLTSKSVLQVWKQLGMCQQL